MLQDLAFGKMENQFRVVEPTAQDIVVCFSDNRVLIKRDEHDALQLPTYEQDPAIRKTDHNILVYGLQDPKLIFHFSKRKIL